MYTHQYILTDDAILLMRYATARRPGWEQADAARPSEAIIYLYKNFNNNWVAMSEPISDYTKQIAFQIRKRGYTTDQVNYLLFQSLFRRMLIGKSRDGFIPTCSAIGFNPCFDGC